MICTSGTENCFIFSHPIVADLALLGFVFFPISSHSTEQSPWAANNHLANQNFFCILLNPKFHYNFHKSLKLASVPVHTTVVHTLTPWLWKTNFNVIVHRQLLNANFSSVDLIKILEPLLIFLMHVACSCPLSFNLLVFIFLSFLIFPLPIMDWDID